MSKKDKICAIRLTHYNFKACL